MARQYRSSFGKISFIPRRRVGVLVVRFGVVSPVSGFFGAAPAGAAFFVAVFCGAFLADFLGGINDEKDYKGFKGSKWHKGPAG